MVRTFFDLKKAEEANPRPSWVKEDDPWNPLSPRKEVIDAYNAVNFPYEITGQDRKSSIWYGLVKIKPEKVTQEITQFYRRRIAGEGEFIFYNVLLRGEDWRGNEKDLDMLVGRYNLPIFKKDRNPENNKVTTSEILDHKPVYHIPWNKETFDDLMESTVESPSLIIYGPGSRRIGLSSVDDFREGSIDDLIQCGMKGKSLDSVIAERSQFTYEKIQQKNKKIQQLEEKATTA